mmetsp:Transcript_16730/g.47613  ORF Transcript_16730/g.47613 Transcript_16730/m.47613 type:complete len:246 (-) Transcript_16730:153-890(-)
MSLTGRVSSSVMTVSFLLHTSRAVMPVGVHLARSAFAKTSMATTQWEPNMTPSRRGNSPAAFVAFGFARLASSVQTSCSLSACTASKRSLSKALLCAASWGAPAGSAPLRSAASSRGPRLCRSDAPSCGGASLASAGLAAPAAAASSLASAAASGLSSAPASLPGSPSFFGDSCGSPGGASLLGGSLAGAASLSLAMVSFMVWKYCFSLAWWRADMPRSARPEFRKRSARRNPVMFSVWMTSQYC